MLRLCDLCELMMSMPENLWFDLDLSTRPLYSGRVAVRGSQYQGDPPSQTVVGLTYL